MVTASGTPILESHPATEPSGTHVRRIGETNVVFAYGTVVPSFDGWRTKEPERNYLDLDGEWKFAFDPDTNGLRDSLTGGPAVVRVSPHAPRGLCSRNNRNSVRLFIVANAC
jgi:hypothetical protein